MKRINQTFTRLTHTEDFVNRYDRVRNEVLSHPDVVKFLNSNSSLIDEVMINKSLMKLYEYTSQCRDCSGCPSLTDCRNMMKGYEPRLVIQGKSIELVYERCERKIKDDERRNREKLIQSLYIPKDILTATLAEIEIDDNDFYKMQAVEAADAFIDD